MERVFYFWQMTNSLNSLKTFLELKCDEFNSPAFITNDPVSVPHLFKLKQDIEISGFLTATLSWGQRPVIIANSLKIIQMMESKPYNFLLNANENEFSRFLRFVHRTFNGDDCLFFLNALKSVYQEHESMETVFLEGYKNEFSVKEGISNLRKRMLLSPHLNRSEKHLSDPEKGSSAKRLNMFLRWMVRDDGKGVDFGIWKSVSSAHLMCPLDVHSGKMARKLGLLNRKQNDWKAVEELTANLRNFDAGDPVKYDFALFGLGIHQILH
jgi:uncharacterized protein (TIGR02757 family)